jgi:hypothetical protein
MRFAYAFFLQVLVLTSFAAPDFAAAGASVVGKNIRIEFDSALHSRVVALFGGRDLVIGDFSPSESIRVSGHE